MNDSPFRIGVIVVPIGPVRPDCFGILDQHGRNVAWLSFEQVRTAMAEWCRLTEVRRVALHRCEKCGALADPGTHTEAACRSVNSWVGNK